ncbi:MAG: rubrerythrin family protein [Planctomycetota bacterium]|nr:rubrerythrin family protein [Planctomycetota bacterium]
MATADNLKAAFAGESQANRKYLAFAKKAEADGLAQIAKLFRAAAEAESVMKGVGTTAENLQAAIEGEGYEFQTMCPEFVAAAEAEGNKPAVMSFRNAMAVEQTHRKLYSEALASLKASKDLPKSAIYVCSVCGHTAVGSAPDKCPVCGAMKDRFAEVK